MDNSCVLAAYKITEQILYFLEKKLKSDYIFNKYMSMVEYSHIWTPPTLKPNLGANLLLPGSLPSIEIGPIDNNFEHLFSHTIS